MSVVTAQSGHKRLRPRVKPVGPEVKPGAEPALRIHYESSSFELRKAVACRENARGAYIFNICSLSKYFSSALASEAALQ